MAGEADPVYVAARRVLLDALEALEDQRAAVIQSSAMGPESVSPSQYSAKSS